MSGHLDSMKGVDMKSASGAVMSNWIRLKNKESSKDSFFYESQFFNTYHVCLGGIEKGKNKRVQKGEVQNLFCHGVQK